MTLWSWQDYCSSSSSGYQLNRLNETHHLVFNMSDTEGLLFGWCGICRAVQKGTSQNTTSTPAAHMKCIMHSVLPLPLCRCRILRAENEDPIYLLYDPETHPKLCVRKRHADLPKSHASSPKFSLALFSLVEAGGPPPCPSGHA
jgi:hypothetical protein